MARHAQPADEPSGDDGAAAPDVTAGDPATAAEKFGSVWLLAVVTASTAALAVWEPTRIYALALVALIALIAIHECGHLLAARTVGVGAGEFAIGFGPVLWRSRRPDRHGTRFAVRAIPLGGYVRIDGLGEAVEGVADPVPGKLSYDDVSAPKRIWISVAGPLANIAATFVILAAVFGSVGVSRPTTAVTPAPSMPAAAAGMRDGDIIVAIGGTPVAEWSDATAAIAVLDPAEPVTVTVDRDGSVVDLTVTPAATTTGEPRLGITAISEREHLGPLRSVQIAATSTGELVWRTTTSMGNIATALLAAPAQLVGADDADDANRLMSPIGAARVAEDSARDVGPLGPIIVIAAISTFLAMFNLLPVPPLDGGHAAIAAYEGAASALRRRRIRVNRQRLAPITAFVVSLVLVMGVTGILLDLLHPIGR